ncbi:hypothetical protein [Tumidithrix helvetica]
MSNLRLPPFRHSHPVLRFNFSPAIVGAILCDRDRSHRTKSMQRRLMG